MSRSADKANSSPAKIRSNRRNARKSTGPTSREGKAVVRWNALKHGLLSREAVITVGNGKENESDFKRLVIQLNEELLPAGIVEEMLVEKIAVCYWRLRRVIRCEVGRIRNRLDNATFEKVFERRDDFLHNKEFVALETCREKLRRSSMGLRFLISILEEMKSEIQESGWMSKDTEMKLFEHFGTDKGGVGFMLYLFNHMATDGQRMTKENPDKYGDTPQPEKCKEVMLKTIDKEIQQMEEFIEVFQEHEGWEAEANKLGLALPDKDSIDKILRYETAVERQFYKALHELIRLQSARKGEKPPTPIAIDVDVSREL